MDSRYKLQHLDNQVPKTYVIVKESPSVVRSTTEACLPVARQSPDYEVRTL